MNKSLRIVTLSLAIILLAFAQASAGEKSIVILHTNDMHASFVPHEAFWVKESPKPLVGGMKELCAVVDSIRKVEPVTLLLDAGDVMTGNPITEREYRGAMGGALFEMMNRIGYDVWCPGNHDFDVSQTNLRKLSTIASFPIVSANLVDPQGNFLFDYKPYLLLERGGMRIGVIGIMSQELYSLVNQRNLVGIRVLSPAETAQKYIDELRSKTDLLVALTHQGAGEDSMLAASVKGLDVIVGGHSHTRLKKPMVVNGVIIVQAGSNCENLGVLTLSIEEGRVARHDGKLIQLWANHQKQTNAVSSFVDSLQAGIERDYSEVIGTLAADWVRRDAQTAIGSFITEAQRKAARAEVAFTNNYGIRKDAPAGPLTKKDLFEILPFRNILTTFQLSGKDLRAVLLYYITAGSKIQITGISSRWKKHTNGSIDLLNVEVQGKPLNESRMYICAASDFFVGEAKRYLGLEIAQPIFLEQTVFEVVEKAVREEKVIQPGIPYRIEQGD